MLNLREIAQDPESSMKASREEQEIWSDLFNHYKTAIDYTGIDLIINNLRDTLSSRYQENPAILPTIDYPLPLEWREYQELEFPPELQEEAIKAYVQNKDHTALRFLSAPNPLMHPLAEYINTEEMRAEFIEYQQEICVFYLAAIDTEFTPTNGYTLDTRLDCFIEELALMARAHNWNPNPNDINEERDDLERDRPSCFSGIKRRLFQSVRGHALTTMLTKDMIQEELRHFVRQHIEKTVNKYNRSAINVAWNKVFEGEELTSEDLAALRILDMPTEKQATLIAFLGGKYGNQFTNNPAFKTQIETAFFLKNSKDAHVLNFGHFQPDDFFNKPDGESSDNSNQATLMGNNDEAFDLSYWLNQYSVGLCVAAFSGLMEALVINAMAVSLTTTLALVTVIGGPIALGVLAGIFYHTLYHAVAPLL